MTRALILLCALGCYVAIDFSSLWAAETFGDWSSPVNVTSLNTASNDEYAVLSRDGLTIYFTSNRPGGLGGLDLWFATRDSAESLLWSNPQNMGPLVNSEVDDSLPFLSPNEHVLYFHSARMRPESCGGQGDIWMTRRRNKHSAWEQPTNLGCDPLGPNTLATETAPALFEDPRTEQTWLFYGSDRTGGPGDFDVYASLLGEHGSAGPGILVPQFSSPKRDTRIFVRKDGLEAFITSNRLGSLNASLDIWVSSRDTPSDDWSTPTNLGIPVNSVLDDVAPWLSKDGTTLYFSSNRAGTIGLRDIWYTTRAKLND
ncbi:MAG TPA: hypothetical protein VFU28_20420 [Vicinamibacterales bacterium]|nr:hypothetical protein [Vicinamibacterales bacterium]